MRSGSGAGAYTTTSAVYVDVDTANLSYTVVVPAGQKVLIAAALGGHGVGVASGGNVAITDGTTVLREHTGIAATTEVKMALLYVFVGDGASHTFKLRFLWNNGGTNFTITNTSATETPTMTFWLGPAS